MGIPCSYGGVITEIQMDQDEIDYMVDLIEKMPDDGLMVEWGCGGSTCKWLETLRPGQRLITIEHNAGWYDRVSRAVKEHFGDVSDRFEFIHAPEQHGFTHGYADPIEEHPIGLSRYIEPDQKIWNADVFFVDGIGRGACALTALLEHQLVDPAFLIHDYVGRESWYDWAVDRFGGREVVGHTLLRLYP